jgi:hypothetical protein
MNPGNPAMDSRIRGNDGDGFVTKARKYTENTEGHRDFLYPFSYPLFEKEGE